MDFHTFLKTVKECLQVELGDNYRVRIINTPKNNRANCESITAFRESEDRHKISRVIPAWPIYQKFQGGKSMEACVADLKREFEEKEDDGEIRKITEMIFRWDRVKGYIYPMMLPAGGNGSLLETVLHRPFLDMEVCYYAAIETDGVMRGTIKVTDTLAALWGLSEEEIYVQAVKNLEGSGYALRNVKEIVLEELLEEWEVPETIGELPMGKSPLYVLTNKNKWQGAAGILNKSFLEKCAMRLKGSFYLLPSSIHEMMVIPDNGLLVPAELRKMVEEINREYVLPEEQLGSTVYYYDAESKKVRIVKGIGDKGFVRQSDNVKTIAC